MPDIVTFFLPGFRFSQEFTVVFDKKNETFFFLLKAVNVCKHWGRNVYGLVPQDLVVGTQNKKIAFFLWMLFFVVQFSSFFFNLRPCQDCKLLTMFSWYKLSQLMKTFFFSPNLLFWGTEPTVLIQTFYLDWERPWCSV